MQRDLNGRPPRWAAWAAGLAVGVAAGLAVGPALIAYVAVRPRRDRPRVKVLEGLPWEEVEFHADDGVTLRGWFIPACRARAVVILCHGYRRARGSMMPFARFLHAADYSCLAFDFRGAGASEGDVCTFGYREAEDVLAAVRHLSDREETSRLPIAGLGLSMGGVALLLAAARDSRIRVVIGDGVYPTLAQAIRRRCELLLGPLAGVVEPIVATVIGRQVGTDPEKVCLLTVAEELGDRPTLFIHSQRDIYLSEAEADALLDRCPEPRALWRAAGAHHCRAFTVAPDEYQRQVLGFLREHGL